MNKGKHFTRVCLDCGKVMENVAGNLRFALPAEESATTNIAGITGRIMKNLPASCGTPSGTQRPAIYWHPARLRCVPGGWATRARTALRLPSAMGSAAAIELTSTHLRGNVSTAARWTACRRYALYEKSPPVRQHRRAARDDGFYRSHQPEDNTFSEVLQDGKKLC